MSDKQTALNEAWADKYLAPAVQNLKRNGVEWLMSSPLRPDRNPSFSVNVEKGTYNDFATGEKGTLSELADRLGVPAPEYAGGRSSSAKRERAADKAERDAQARVDAAKIEAARAIWAAASPDVAGHPYLTEKQIDAQGLELRRLTGEIRIEYPKGDGANTTVFANNQLVVPLYDVRTNALVGVELIDNAKGRRRPDKFAKEQYRPKAENYPAIWEAGKCTDRTAPVVLCEGMATAASVKQIAQSAARVLCCFSSENIPAIGRMIAKRNPSLRLIVASDADAAGEKAFLDLVNGVKKKTANGRDSREWEYEPVAALEVRPPAKRKTAGEVPEINSIDDEIAALLGEIRDEHKSDDSKTDWNDVLIERGLDDTKQIFFLRLTMERERARLAAMSRAEIRCEARTLSELTKDKNLKEYEWIIPDLLPAAGLSILAGISGCGKSFLALRLAIEAARGGSFLGRSVEKTDVLYLALEDPAAMIVQRSRDVLGLGADELEELNNIQIEAIGAGRGLSAAESGELHLDRQGMDYFTSWIFEHITARRRLIIVDVMQEILPDSKNARGNAYQIAYETLSPLKLLATRTNTDILFIHHASNKNGASQKGGDPFDKMLGSVGYKAAMQARFMLDGSVKEGKAMLVTSVKGASDKDDIPLRWDTAIPGLPGGWRLATDEERRKEEAQAVENGLSARDAQIMDVLNEHPDTAFSLKEVAQLAGLSYDYIRRRSKGLIEKGLIVHDGLKIRLCLPDYLRFSFEEEDTEKEREKEGENNNSGITPYHTHHSESQVSHISQKNVKKESEGFTKDFSVIPITTQNEGITLANADEYKVQSSCDMCDTSVVCDVDFVSFSPDSLLRAFDETGKAPPIIQPVGETLSSLAARAGVTVEQLREAIDDKENADLIDRLDLRGDVLTVAPMEQPESNGSDSSFADVLPVGSEESL